MKQSYLQYVNACEPKDVPKGEHFAILTFGQVSQQGYDVGDPSYDVSVCYYKIYQTKEAWEEEIRSLQIDKKKYVPLISRQPIVTTEVRVSIKE